MEENCTFRVDQSDIGSVLEKEVGDVPIAPVCGPVKRRVPVRVALVDVCSGSSAKKLQLLLRLHLSIHAPACVDVYAGAPVSVAGVGAINHRVYLRRISRAAAPPRGGSGKRPSAVVCGPLCPRRPPADLSSAGTPPLMCGHFCTRRGYGSGSRKGSE